MPPVEAYPKSHIVTFKYYVGVILFLEEDYGKVGTDADAISVVWADAHFRLPGRREPHRCMADVSQRREAESRVGELHAVLLPRLTDIIDSSSRTSSRAIY